MRSLLGSLLNRTPVPYTATDGRSHATAGPFWGRNRTSQLHSMSTIGTLFSIVNRTSVSTASVNWHMHRPVSDEAAVCPRCECAGVRLVDTHPALVVWNKPNNFFTRQELVESGQQHIDLTGEGWMVVAKLAGRPIEVWPVRPDRMEPVPSKRDFLAGYIYHGPDGEKVPLDLDEVIQIRMPDPEDPYRGLGAVQAAMRDIDAGRLAAEWNRNFFYNSAEPGGIIEVEGALSDTQFQTLKSRWDEQHKGVSRAHRVAIIEQGKWVPRTYTNRDMQFTELRHLSSEMIQEAFGISDFALGKVKDVNRATAEASKTWFAEQMTVPRLDRWKGALNNDFLPLFGPTGKGVEFVYDNPVPPNRESANAERDSKTKSYKVLIEAGVDPDDAADTVGLPRMRTREKADA